MGMAPGGYVDGGQRVVGEQLDRLDVGVAPQVRVEDLHGHGAEGAQRVDDRGRGQCDTRLIARSCRTHSPITATAASMSSAEVVGARPSSTPQ